MTSKNNFGAAQDMLPYDRLIVSPNWAAFRFAEAKHVDVNNTEILEFYSKNNKDGFCVVGAQSSSLMEFGTTEAATSSLVSNRREFRTGPNRTMSKGDNPAGRDTRQTCFFYVSIMQETSNKYPETSYSDFQKVSNMCNIWSQDIPK